MQAKKTEKSLIGICTGLLFLIFLSILIVMFTRLILVNRMGVQNGFTDFVLGDAFEDEKNQEQGSAFHINWKELYPFESDGITPETKSRTPAEIIWSKIGKTKERFEFYSSRALLGYRTYVELAEKYESLVGWNFASYGEYNGVVEMPDGYLTAYVEKRDVTEQANALIGLDRFCRENGCDFLYIQAPSKVCKYDDRQISGSSDFSNQNADEIIKTIEESGVDVLDLRDSIHDAGFSHHGMFYRTDHHWLTTTGLWVAQRTLEHCNENCGFNADISRLELGRFDQKVYKDWFLGSRGKKVTLSRTSPEDFVLLYPKYETKLHFVVPEEQVDAYGDYSIIYNMEEIAEKDLYGKNPYRGYNYGDQPVIQIDNLADTDGKRILIIDDSFGNCVISCLALCESEVDSLDLRYFTGSLENYIRTFEPDIVMVLYNAENIGGTIDRTTHKDIFDFR